MKEDQGVASGLTARPQTGTTLLHTPGPWRLAELHAIGMYANDGAAVVMAGDLDEAYLVANVAAHAKFKRGRGHNLADDPTRDANARLIVAAPELLEALDWLLASYERKAADENHPADREERLMLACAAARNTIRKATGRDR